ncbi:MAG: Tyrosine-tRNA ligase [Candidatus Azambacteria bacterium GW2011_GWA2_39_10]|uniref:Tyrosine--tRNA ligase n=1 Tax=Candidatus Azambacteria bacterium GW2011_GWA2_39_10 TaxID=1618611 RepID=A0A0G0LTR9_9BACT|nr:MAG: Tyrosine-tRNA ligase [Candidatus Azambacteria bacterium GW2011_GWA2_39_10]
MEFKSKDNLIKEVLTKQIDKIYPSKESLAKILKSGKILTIYWGIDPTAHSLHIAHGANLFILRRFQNLGHKAIVLLGDFTAQIGDPSDRRAKRVSLTEKQVLSNLKNYKKQIFKILDPKKTTVKFNSEWWRKVSAKNLLDLARLITHQRIIDRHMFQERIKKGETITVEELLYPIIQGYDSVALNTDIELGGTDQLFNMLVGRDLEKILLKKEKFVITKPILSHPKTGEMLMSKTSGGAIFISESADQMYGKIMALTDEVIIECFKLCTDTDDSRIRSIESCLKAGENPRNLKSELAFEIVKIYHGEKKAKEAAEEFERIFKRHELPENIQEVSITIKPRKLIELLMQAGLASSRSEARRKVLENAVKVDGKVKKDPEEVIDVYEGAVVQYGKRNFRKIKKG